MKTFCIFAAGFLAAFAFIAAFHGMLVVALTDAALVSLLVYYGLGE